MSGKLPRDIILFSTADWDNPFWTNKQHMAAMLAKRGFRVLYVESVGLRRPMAGRRDASRIIRRIGKGLRGIRQVRENLWIYSPLVIPAHGKPILRFLNNGILVRSIKTLMRRLHFGTPLIWTYNPLSVDVMERLKHAMVIYHCVDDLTSAPGMPSESIRKAEETLVRKADLVFTTSPRLQDTRSRGNPGNTHFFPNVVDFEHFSSAREAGPVPDDLAGISKPRIGFVGALSDYKVDFDLIARVAGLRADWQWVLIGQVGEGQPGTSVEKLAMPNIHLLGPRPYEDLPEYLRGFDVATIPCPHNEYTTSMFPMKFFEYLSAGKPVVATDLPSLKEYNGACLIVRSAEEFVSAVENVLAGSRPDESLCLELAKRNTWDRRTDRMLELIARKCEGRKENNENRRST